MTPPSRPALADLVAHPLRFVDDADPKVRRLAVSALANRLDPDAVTVVRRLLAGDPDVSVRAEAAEVLGGDPEAAPLLLSVGDDDPRVVEAAITALGSLGHRPAVPWLIDQAVGAADPLVREAAVAALGEIGDPEAIEPLLDLVTSGPPQVRRRSVVALTVFDDERIPEALRTAAADRNPMVREAAEMVVGRPDEWEPVTLLTQRPDHS